MLTLCICSIRVNNRKILSYQKSKTLFFFLTYTILIYPLIYMLEPIFRATPFKYIDQRSEVSTDSDDIYHLPSFSHHNKKKAKSSLCRNFCQKGYCPYGYKCQFAHGLQQLKCNTDENAYKTKPCNSYWKKGYCFYGLRCNFSHLNDEKEAEPTTIEY